MTYPLKKGKNLRILKKISSILSSCFNIDVYICCCCIVHPCEKVIGIFFQNQIWSRLLDINRLCLICIKRSIEEVKMCQIYKRGYQKGPSDETLKKARYQFCDVKFGHRITVAMGLFDYKMCNLPQFPLISQTGEARVLFHDLLVLFCINDIFVNYT